MIKKLTTKSAETLVTKWGKTKLISVIGKKRAINRPQILLTSGRGKEGEESLFENDAVDVDYELREQIDQYCLDNVVVDECCGEAIRDNVEQLRDWLLDGMVKSLVKLLAEAVITGVEDALIEKKSEMNQQTTPAGMARNNMEMYVIVHFTDAIYVEQLG